MLRNGYDYGVMYNCIEKGAIMSATSIFLNAQALVDTYKLTENNSFKVTYFINLAIIWVGITDARVEEVRQE